MLGYFLLKNWHGFLLLSSAFHCGVHETIAKLNIYEMKKLIVMALAALPMCAMAQDKGKTSDNAPVKPEVQRPVTTNNPESIFIELIVAQTNVGNKIKMDYGRELLSNVNDKELVQTLSDMRNTDFQTMPDAMNYLAVQGFKFVTNYTLKDKDGKDELHIVFEKRMMKKPGSGRPEGRPDAKPAEVRPETKPASKPATKPTEKGEKK